MFPAATRAHHLARTSTPGLLRAGVSCNDGARSISRLALYLSLILVALLAYVASANAAEPLINEAAPTRPAGPALVALHAQVEDYLEARLGVDLPHRELEVALQPNGGGVLGWTNDDRIVLDPYTATQARNVATGLCRRDLDQGGLLVVIHETLHPRYGGPWWVEEGFTEAVAEDELPGLWREVCGTRLARVWGGIYPTRVKWARAASAALAGTGPNTRQAREMRRAVLFAFPWTRTALIEQAEAIRAGRS